MGIGHLSSQVTCIVSISTYSGGNTFDFGGVTKYVPVSLNKKPGPEGPVLK